MGRVQAVTYQFEECQCNNVRGTTETIPAGIYLVAELDVVSVHIGMAVLDFPAYAFNLLKAQGKARKIS